MNCCRGCGEFYEVFDDFGYEGHVSGKFFCQLKPFPSMHGLVPN